MLNTAWTGPKIELWRAIERSIMDLVIITIGCPKYGTRYMTAKFMVSNYEFLRYIFGKIYVKLFTQAFRRIDIIPIIEYFYYI